MHKDRSFVTFDKKPFNFTLRGQCEHELLRMCDKRKTDIAVTTRKVGETKKRAVTIVVESKTFEFIPEGEMHEQPTIMVDLFCFSISYLNGLHSRIIPFQRHNNLGYSYTISDCFKAP